jgi:hypothetical protein
MPGSGIAVEDLRLHQWGKEAARGTLVAATSKIAIEGMDFEPLDSVDRPDLAKGLAIRTPGNETVITRGTRISVPETDLIYDQIHNFLSSLKGGVTPTGANPYTWTFAPSLTADPAPDSWTLERRLSDGTNNVDNRWGYCLFSELKFSYQLDRPLRFSAQGFARRVQPGPITAALALPTIEIPPSPLAQAWIDSTWAALGTTLVSTQILKADVTIHTGLMPKLALDGRADLDFSTYIFNGKERGIDVEMTAMVQAAGGQYATEKTAAEAQTLRAMRLKVLGTSSREMTFDMLLKHVAGSVFKVDEEDGQDIVQFKLQESNDATNWLSAKVVNAVAAYV